MLNGFTLTKPFSKDRLVFKSSRFSLLKSTKFRFSCNFPRTFNLSEFTELTKSCAKVFPEIDAKSGVNDSFKFPFKLMVEFNLPCKALAIGARLLNSSKSLKDLAISKLSTPRLMLKVGVASWVDTFPVIAKMPSNSFEVKPFKLAC